MTSEAKLVRQLLETIEKGEELLSALRSASGDARAAIREGREAVEEIRRAIPELTQARVMEAVEQEVGTLAKVSKDQIEKAVEQINATFDRFAGILMGACEAEPLEEIVNKVALRRSGAASPNWTGMSKRLGEARGMNQMFTEVEERR
jgi:methyl-accepting chemotaxis protein